MPLLEICCFSPASAITAQRAGADRIEFCRDREAGGTSPSVKDAVQIASCLPCPVFTMVRPRGGDFTYSEAEFEQMKADLLALSDHSAGMVFGCLTSDRRVDVTKTAELVQLAAGLPCTFHRAFDEVADPFQALEDVISTGCSAILTSGTACNVSKGAHTIAQLVERAQGRIEIMLGGGVRADNIIWLRKLTRAECFHSSGILQGSEIPDEEEIRTMRALVHQEMTASLSPYNRSGSETPIEDMMVDMERSAVSIGPSRED